MADPGCLTVRFEHWRPYLATVAYNMLGSVVEAEDAVQRAWERLYSSDADAINGMRGWLTTVVGRICIDMLRARQTRREDYAGVWLPEPLVVEPAEDGPQHQAEIADSVDLAMLAPGGSGVAAGKAIRPASAMPWCPRRAPATVRRLRQPRSVQEIFVPNGPGHPPRCGLNAAEAVIKCLADAAPYGAVRR